MKKINCQYNVQVPDGPKLGETRSIDVEAYDCINVMVPATAEKSVEVETGTGKEDVAFVLLKAERYNDLWYGTGTAATTSLDGPVILVGAGSISKHFGAGLAKLLFKNSGEQVLVTLLIGRQAMKTPE